MNPNTARILRMFLSSLVAGIMGAGGILLSSMTETGATKPGTWLIAGVSFAMFVAKDIQSSLSTAPTIPSNTEGTRP